MTPIRCCELVDALSKASTVETLHEICAEFCLSFEFDHFIYGAQLPTSLAKPSYIYISGYPAEWRRHYDEHGYLGIDPVVSHCARYTTPLVWTDLEGSIEHNTPARRVMHEAADFGLRSGFSFPVHANVGGFAILSIVSDELARNSSARTKETLPSGQLFVTHLHEAVRRIFSQDGLAISRVKLTNREQQCLLWAAEGKTTWETSKILGVSERTVVFHIQNASQKLQVNNRQQAVARSISLGLISPVLN